MKLNPKMAELLDFHLEPEPRACAPIVVRDEEVVRVDNPRLPPLEDADRSLVEGEKQLEKVIGIALEQVDDLREAARSAAPMFKGRLMEAANMTLTTALQAVQTKIETQFKKKVQRMKEQEFGRKGADEVHQTNNIIFRGRRDDFVQQIMDAIKPSQQDEQ